MDQTPVISFDNTEIAFRRKNDRQLKRSYWLFHLIGKPWMVTVGKHLTNTALALRIPIGWAIKGNIFQQFCGGETIEECQRAIDGLWQYRVGTILDYSVEGKDKESDLDHTMEETIRTIEASAGNPSMPFCVFKVTGIARFELLEKVNAKTSLSSEEANEWQRVQQRVEKICEAAHRHQQRLFIDAEDSWIQDAIDALATSMMICFNKESAIIYNTIQLYRHDRLAFMKECLDHAKNSGYFLGFKLVRGAYMEKERARALAMGYPDPIQPDKASTDRDFDHGLQFCMENLDRISICAGTHNEASSMMLVSMMQERNIALTDDRIFFAQLYGMSDHISYNLAESGCHVAKYLPYGPIREVMPYLIRRAQENTSVKGQTGRELGLIQKEIQRRKKKS
ncbi:MAG: proline dehydrogenase family protein [Flavobacteriales bacterium]